MRCTFIRFCAAAAFALMAVSSSEAADIVTRTIKGNFDDIRFELGNVIVERGLAVNSEGNVAAMLDRTGKDVGSAKAIYKNAQYITFCSAVHSRRMMEANPAFMGNCPYVLFVYETVDRPGEIAVGYRSVMIDTAKTDAEKRVLGEIDQWLGSIVAAVAK